ncbi:MAG: glycosyltransferase family 4 protein [Candidatus Sungiibacteriota bacterium]
MKILMMSADPAILMSGTDAAERMRGYARFFDELHIVVFCRGRAKEQHEGNLFLYAGWGAVLPIRFFRAWRLGSACIRRSRCEVITAQGADETGALAWLLARRFGVPFQLQIHTDVMSPRYREVGWKERTRYLLARFLIPRANCIRTVSERIRDSLLRQPNPLREVGLRTERMCVLPIFTDVSRFLNAVPDLGAEQRFKNYHFKMIAVGRFVDKEKNFSMLIDVMRLFVRICPQALLVIVGEGPDEKNYKLQITNYKLEKNVIVEPWRDDLSSFYKSFDLFVSSSHYEGWGRVVIEAMAAGLAVVMTDVGLAGEVVKNGENGIVVPVGDQTAFLEAIKTLYENPQKRKTLAAAGREAVENLQPKTRAEYLARYRESLASYSAKLDRK